MAMKTREKGNKKVLIGVCVGVSCVAIVSTIFVLSKSKPNGTEIIDVVESQQVDDENIIRLEAHKGTTTSVKNEENEVPKVSIYADIEISEEEIIKLVKETIMYAKERLQDAKDNGETGRVRILIPAIEDTRR